MNALERLVNNGPAMLAIPILIGLYFIHVFMIAVPLRVAATVERRIRRARERY